MSNEDKIKKSSLSRFLCLVLRHKPEEIGLKLDKNGWADVDDLIERVTFSGRKISLDMLKEIVATDDKNRYSFSDDKKKIRANQGHSIPVDVQLKSVTPPDKLYHGTATRFLDSIKMNGIKSMKRLYVHLSSDIDTAIAVGARHGVPVVLEINAKDMKNSGIEFFISENGVYLTNDIDYKYISRFIFNNNQ